MNSDNIRRILRALDKRKFTENPLQFAEEVSHSIGIKDPDILLLLDILTVEMCVAEDQAKFFWTDGSAGPLQDSHRQRFVDKVKRQISLAQELIAPLENEKAEQRGQESSQDVVRETTLRLEKDLITRALQECAGNIPQAANRLKISEKSLQRKIVELDIKAK